MRKIVMFVLLGTAVILMAASPIQFHTLLSATHTDTLPYGPPVAGDLIAGNSSGKWERVAPNISTSRQVLTMTGDGASGSVPVWGDLQTAHVVNRTSIINQVGPFPSTILVTPANDGLFRVSLYLQSASMPNDQVIVDWVWNDGSQQFNSIGIGTLGTPLTNVRDSANVVIHAVSGSNIIIRPGVNFNSNTAVYNLRVVVEEL